MLRREGYPLPKCFLFRLQRVKIQSRQLGHHQVEGPRFLLLKLGLWWLMADRAKHHVLQWNRHDDKLH